MADPGELLVKALDHYGATVRPDHSREQTTLCPLGHEGFPSCSVNVARGLWNCHSCGEGGDALSLIILREGLGNDDRPRSAAYRWAEINLGVDPVDSSRPRRAGLSGEPRAGTGGGYRPAFRRRPGLAG